MEAALGEAAFTVDDALDMIPLGRFHVKLFVVCGFAWMVDAMEVLLLAFVGPAVRCEWGVTDFQAAMMATIVFAGMSVGSVFWGAVADAYGRRTSLLISTAVIFVAGLACAFAPSFGALLTARMVVGIGVSGVPVAFSLLMEFLPVKARGRLGIALCFWWSAGAMAEAGLARLVMPTLGWRWLLALSTFPVVFLLLLAPCIPESARFYASQGRMEEAERVVKAAMEANGVTMPARELQRPARTQADTSASVADLFAPGLRRLTISQWALWFCGAFSYYGSVLLTTELLSADPCSYRHASPVDNAEQDVCRPLTDEDYNANFVATAGELPGLLLTFMVIDVIGRRRTIGWPSLLLALALALIIPCTAGTFQDAMLFIMRATVASLFQAMYVYTGEVYPSSVRALGIGWCCSFSRLGGMSTPFVAQVLSRTSTRFALAVYSFVALVCAALAFTLQIETTGRPMLDTVDQLLEELGRHSSSKKPSRWLALAVPEPSAATSAGDSRGRGAPGVWNGTRAQPEHGTSEMQPADLSTAGSPARHPVSAEPGSSGGKVAVARDAEARPALDVWRNATASREAQPAHAQVELQPAAESSPADGAALSPTS